MGAWTADVEMGQWSSQPAGKGIFATILPDGCLALKLMAMTYFAHLRDAWDCTQCRFYRRAGLALGVLAACFWLLL
jgi:hypothetical protein